MENCGDLVLISAGESFDVFQKASADEKICEIPILLHMLPVQTHH